MSERRPLTHRQKQWIAGTGIALFVLLSILICWFAGRPLIHFAKEPELFRDWVDRQGVWGPLLFMGMVILQIVVAVIPGEPLEIVAGYAFGAVEGTLLCLLGAFVGRVAVFLLVRRFGTRWISSNPWHSCKINGGLPSGCFSSSSCRVRRRMSCATLWG